MRSGGKSPRPREAAAPLRPPAVWPDFRGPARDGRSLETIRTAWPSDGPRRLWKQPIGLGYASFVVADGRAFTIEQRRGQEVLAAYDVETGRELWTNSWDAEFVESMGGDGPRATPTYHDGRVYALGALGELRCLDAAAGTVIWRRNILEDNGASNLDWGMSASPLVVDEKLIVLPGGRGGRSVVAYHKNTGDAIWRALDDRQAYVSPMLATLGGVRQVVMVSASRAAGLDLEHGSVLWEYPWATSMGINVAQPVLLGDDRVFLSASYGQGAAVFEVVRTGTRFATRTIWENSRMKNKFTTSLLHEGHLYGLDEAILACIDAATGELKWKGGRYGYGQPILVGSHLIVLTEGGDVVLVKANPERHEELARFPAIEGKTWNHPVLAEGRLLVRNLREMAAFDLR
jgi:outer membrane protein assembly factor BamB